jgi:hypothetical protein
MYTMKLSRMLLALAMVLAVASVAYVSQRTDPPASRMALAAQKFVESLTPEQKKKALIDFDNPERTNWHFVPLQDKQKQATRKGLPLEDMEPQQKRLALALLAAGTSETGNKQATTIMSLEAILKVLEAKKPDNVRDPQWYFFAIFGTPGKTGPWGWRVEGHHLSINYTLDNNEVVTATPTFFGANPAMIKDGPKKGERTLPEAEDYAIALFKALTPEQQAVAVQKQKFGEPNAKSPKSGVGQPLGIPATKLDPKQRDLLMKLVRSYADRLTPEVAAAELKQVQDAGTDKIHFAYTGSTEPGEGHTYRVQGPTFVIEFLNVQADSAGNPANHIHSCWRRIEGDFGIKTK